MNPEAKSRKKGVPGDDELSKLVHDVRGHLNSIVMNSELARMLAENSDGAERIARLMDVVIRQCGECNKLVEAFRQQHGGGE